MKVMIPMREALNDCSLLGTAMMGTSWLGWRALLIATLGEPLNDEERRAFEKLTGRAHEPLEVVEELIVVAGRRGGKSLAGAVLLVYLACLVDWSEVLTIGERGVALSIAQNTKQATVTFNYAKGIIAASPLLTSMVTNQTAETIELNNGITLEVRPASFRSLRGVTSVAILADECAYWLDTGANADSEILGAVRPSLATTGGLLAILSSPYAQKGELWELYSENFGPDGDPRILVAKGASRDLNPTLSRRVVDRAIQRDPVGARAEYLGMFRQDVTGFISRELLQAAVDTGVTSRPPNSAFQHFCFADASSGIASSGDGDRYGVAVGHDEDGVAVIDYCQIWHPPFDASAITKAVAEVAARYKCSEVITDGFSSGFVRAELARHGVGHRISELDKSGCYLASLPMLTSHRVRLLDLPFLIDEFAALERRPGSGGRDKVDARGHEDGANVVAGVIALLSAGKPEPSILTHYKRMSEAANKPTTAPQATEHYGLMQVGAQRVLLKDAVKLVVPTSMDISAYVGASGLNHPVTVENGDRVIWISRQDATAMLTSGMASAVPWVEANRDLANDLRAYKKPEASIRAADFFGAIEDMRPRSPFDKGGMARDTLRMCGIRGF